MKTPTSTTVAEATVGQKASTQLVNQSGGPWTATDSESPASATIVVPVGEVHPVPAEETELFSVLVKLHPFSVVLRLDVEVVLAAAQWVAFDFDAIFGPSLSCWVL